MLGLPLRRVAAYPGNNYCVALHHNLAAADVYAA